MLDSKKFSRLKSIANRWKQDYGVERVLLFGSQAENRADEESDIDLLIILRTKEKFHRRIASALQTVLDLSRDLPLSPIVLTPDEVQTRLNRGDQFVQKIVETGIEI